MARGSLAEFRLVEDLLCAMRGEVCWSLVAGPGTGSMISMSLGRKIKRDRPIRNSYLSRIQQEYDGEYGVFIQQAAWKLKYQGNVLCTSNDSNEFGGPMLRGLKRLIGKRVHSVYFMKSTGGFKIIFEKQLSLVVRCDRLYDDAMCYSLFGPEHIIAVSEDKKVNIESR